MAKKKQSENVQNAYDAYASEVQNTGQDLVNGMTAAGQQQIADMEAANQAYNDANAQAMEANRQQSGAAINSFADMVEQYARNIRGAEDEGAAQVAADQRAARWTGATELASSIANLIAVGGHNAVSQQYRPYSQDWMRKADQDARLNRMRIDNLRERQRAMQGQLANMKLNDAAKALELARADAKAKYEQGLALAGARYNTTINPLTQAAKNAEAVGKINAQGAAQTADVALGEQRIAQSAAQHAASMRARGLNPDGTINEEAMGKLIAAEQAQKAGKSGSGSGSGSGNAYNVQFDGQNVTLRMNKETREQSIRDGKEEFLRDVMAMAGFKGTPEEFIQSVNEDTIKENYVKNGKTKTRTSDNPNREYRAIVNAITNQDGDEEAATKINQFYELHRSKMNNVNRRLFTVANGATSFGSYGTETGNQTAEEPTSPASSGSQQTASSTPWLDRKKAGMANVSTSNRNESEPTSSTPAQQPPVSQPTSPATEQPSQLGTMDGSSYKIDKGRYVKAATEVAMDSVNKAINDYNASRTGNSRISETTAKIVKDEINRRLRHGDDIRDIINDSKYLPRDFGGYVTDDALETFREVERDKEGLSAREFSKKYLYPSKV